MKKLCLLLFLLFPLSSQATYLALDPELQLGVGLRFPAEKAEPFVRPNLISKAYFYTFAEDELFSYLLGLKLLGVGAQLDTKGDLRPVISPVCAYMFNVCVGPDLVFHKLNQVDFGASVSIRF